MPNFSCCHWNAENVKQNGKLLLPLLRNSEELSKIKRAFKVLLVQCHMSSVSRVHWYHFLTNLTWWDGPCKKREKKPCPKKLTMLWMYNVNLKRWKKCCRIRINVEMKSFHPNPRQNTRYLQNCCQYLHYGYELSSKKRRKCSLLN